MKRKLLFAIVALLCSVGSWAQEAPTNGSAYYIYNEDNDLFFTRGADWGTQAFASPVGIPWRVEIADGKYTLKMYDIYTQNDADKGLGFNGSYTDNGSPIALTPSGNASDGYTLENGGNYITCPASKGVVSMTSTASVWKFLTQAQYDAVLASRASAQETAVATSKGIVIPGGNTLNDVVSDASAWASSTTNDALPTTATWAKSGGTQRGNYYNEGIYGVELFESNDASISKTISGLASGIYKVSVRGMRRDGTNGCCAAMKTAGFYPRDVYMEANGNIIPVKAWADDNTASDNPDSPAQTVAIINNGGYTSEGFVYVGDDGNLTLTIYTDAFWWGCWFVFNGISYTYYNDTVSDDDATAILATATSLESDPMLGTVLSALSSAKTTFDGARTISNYNALSTAITNANTSKTAYANAKAYLDEAATILASTNVYTAAAYAEKYSTPNSKYAARTLTNEEANAFVKTSTGWHSANTIDDILLSAWTIGGEQCANFDKSLYINTWSTEGATDGSEFLAPFFEYWTNDDKSLGANTIVATVTGLKASTTYTFAIRGRVRQTNSKSKIANGITMKVGEGESVDISAGTIFGTGPFYIGNFSAVGETDAEGKLTCTITVAENSNISWLSFYNAKYTEGEDLSAYIADYEFALTTANSYNLKGMDPKLSATFSSAVTAATLADANTATKAELIQSKADLDAAVVVISENAAAFAGSSVAGWTRGEDTNGSFEVNTWSTEGNSDGSNMRVPFIQNWRAKEQGALVNKTISYAMTGEAQGYYKVTCLVRALNEAGGVDPAGVFLFANDNIERAYGANATACTNGVYSNPEVYGYVGEDGNLTIGFKLIGNTCNWISWKNLTIEYVGSDLNSDIATNQTEEVRSFENLTTGAAAAQSAAVSALSSLNAANYVAAGQAIEAAYRAIDREFSALQAAIAEKENYTLGFLAGEYAPYSGVEAAYTAATAIDQNSDATSQSDINTAAANLAAITANVGEVNAIYDGTFSNAPVANATVGVNGWSAATGLRQLVESDVVGSIVTTGMYVWGNNTVTYGETTGYTLPLKAGTVYKLTYDRASWSGGSSSHTGVTITDPNGTELGTATEDGWAGDWNSTDGTLLSRAIYFVTTTAGNYKLALGPWGNSVYANMALYTTNDVLTFADGSLPSYVPGTYPNVALTRTFASTDNWYTLCVPFEFDKSEFAAVKELDAITVNGEKVSMSLTDASTIVAGKPYLVKPKTDNYDALSATDAAVVNNVVESSATASGYTVNYVGTFAAKAFDGSENNAFVLMNNRLYNVTESGTVGAYRAYFTVEAETPVKALSFDFGDATGIGGLTPDPSLSKRGEEIYNLAGQRMSKLQRGVNIVNGKKVMVK